MKKLLDWLAKEVPQKSRKWFILSAVCLSVVWSICVIMVLDFFGIELPQKQTMGLKIATWYFHFILFILAAIEEALFRLPLAAITYKLGKSRVVLLAILLSSVIFGLLHGGFICIFIQGVSGIILCAVFLKCGGFQENARAGFLASVLTHYLCNVVLIWLAFMGGLRYF